MASTLASSIVGSKAALVGGSCSSASCKPRVLRASSVRCQAVDSSKEQGKIVDRRALVAGVGVGILSLVANTRVAQAIPPVPPGEPKPGTKEAKKFYAKICVSNATAAVCHG